MSKNEDSDQIFLKQEDETKYVKQINEGEFIKQIMELEMKIRSEKSNNIDLESRILYKFWL